MLLHKVISSTAITVAAATQISFLLTVIALIYDASQGEHEEMWESMMPQAGCELLESHLSPVFESFSVV